jgi:hypothetical protein
MSREQLERFVEAVETLLRSDLAEAKRRWREEQQEREAQDLKERAREEREDLKELDDLDGLKATFKKIEEERRQWERDAATAASGTVTWIPPDPLSSFHLPPDLTLWFVETAKRVLSGVESLDRALGLLRPPGRPVDPNTSKNLIDLAEMAMTLRMQGKTWYEINTVLFADKAEPPDERYIRRVVARYKPLVMRRWLHQRWRARSEERMQRTIQRNQRKGKTGL